MFSHQASMLDWRKAPRKSCASDVGKNHYHNFFLLASRQFPSPFVLRPPPPAPRALIKNIDHVASRRAFFVKFKCSAEPGKQLTLTLSYPHCWHFDSHFAACGKLLAQNTNALLIFPKTLHAVRDTPLENKERTAHQLFFCSR